jgi:hypothetical protein
MRLPLIVAAALAASALAMSPEQQPLLQAKNLEYVGAFRLPAGRTDQESFEFGGSALAYNPAHDSLFIVGHAWYQRVAEISIPKPAIAPSVDGLASAALLQPLGDVLEGQITKIGVDKSANALIGGLLVWNDTLIVSDFLYYDAGASQVLSHFRSTLDLARTGDLIGPVQVGKEMAGFVSGYMTPIPPEWREALGGPALTGQCCVPIISRTSLGPAVSVFDPALVGVKSPVPAKMVLGYPVDHATLGSCGSGPDALFNCVTSIGGVVFPAGTRSLLFFGRQGLGPYCYGLGVPDKPDEKSQTDCLDPLSGSKGPHAYPYTHRVWAYDVLDLIKVKQGKKRPWDIRPYTTWQFDLPLQSGSGIIQGAAYDPATQRVFVSADHGDGRRPLMHVLRVAP